MILKHLNGVLGSLRRKGSLLVLWLRDVCVLHSATVKQAVCQDPTCHVQPTGQSQVYFTCMRERGGGREEEKKNRKKTCHLSVWFQWLTSSLGFVTRAKCNLCNVWIALPFKEQ